MTDPAKFKEYQDAQNALTGALGRLVTVERYPDLKSNQNFLVQAYNTELKTFPGVIWASMLYRGYKPIETFTVAEDVRKVPTVKF